MKPSGNITFMKRDLHHHKSQLKLKILTAFY